MRRLATTLLASLLVSCGPALGQIPRDALQEVQILRAQALALDGAGIASPSMSMAQSGVRRGLSLYRFLFSSRDATNCQFDPSCSRYAEEAVRTRGSVTGFLMASDRLQRCHPFASRYYRVSLTRGKLLDSPEDHRPNGEPSPDANSRPLGSFRSPALAMVLSGTVPGAGQIYAGRGWDGVFAGLQTGSSAAFSYLNFDRDGVHSIRGWVHAVLAGGFYLGNVWGAGDAARRTNRTGRAPATFPVGVTEAPQDPPSTRWLRGELERRRAAEEEGPEDSLGARSYAVGICAFAAWDLDASADAFRRTLEHAADDSLRRGAEFFLLLTEVERFRWGAAHRRLDDWVAAVEGSCRSIELDGSSTEEPDARAARCRDLPMMREAGRWLSLRGAFRHRSPPTARVLSAVVPGAGQAYAGEYASGLAALAVHAVSGLYLASCIRSRSYGEIALVSWPFFWRYYRGNLRAAGRMTRERNEQVEARWREEFYWILNLER